MGPKGMFQVSGPMHETFVGLHLEPCVQGWNRTYKNIACRCTEAGCHGDGCRSKKAEGTESKKLVLSHSQRM